MEQKDVGDKLGQWWLGVGLPWGRPPRTGPSKGIVELSE